MFPKFTTETLAQTIQVSTYAGSDAGFADGDALTQAKFLFPSGVGVCVGPDGNVYVADQGNHTIRKITPDGQVTTIAGNGEQGFVDGQGTTARFISPTGLDFDNTGNIYIADQNNHAIRKISTTGFVSTLAGTGSAGSEDGPALSATFISPVGVAVDDTGNVYVVSLGNQNIRKISVSGFVSTLAGHPTNNGHQDGQASIALFYRPSGIAIDNSGNIYVSEEGNHDIRKITPGLIVSTIAGTGHFGAGPGSGGFADGDALTVAQFNSPDGIMVNSAGDIFVADACNQRIRKISNRFVSTLAGSGPVGCGYGGFADGDVSVALFNNPMSVCHNDAGDLFVADQWNNRVRRVSINYPIPFDVEVEKPLKEDSTFYAFDRFGNIYSKPQLRTVAHSHGGLHFTAGYFQLDFSEGEFEDQTSTKREKMAEIVCKVFSDLSGFIQPSTCDGTNPILKIHIRNTGTGGL